MVLIVYLIIGTCSKTICVTSSDMCRQCRYRSACTVWYMYVCFTVRYSYWLIHWRSLYMFTLLSQSIKCPKVNGSCFHQQTVYRLHKWSYWFSNVLNFIWPIKHVTCRQLISRSASSLNRSLIWELNCQLNCQIGLLKFISRPCNCHISLWTLQRLILGYTVLIKHVKNAVISKIKMNF